MKCNKLMKETLDMIIEKPKVPDFDAYVLEHNIDKTIKNYSTAGYMSINKGYLKGVPNKELDKLFKIKGNFVGTTYRGTKTHSNHINVLVEGDYIKTRMPLSTSKDRDIALAWARNYMRESRRKHSDGWVDTIITIRHRPWEPGYDIEHFSKLPKEKEVLVAPNVVLRIAEIKNMTTFYGNLLHIKLIPVKKEDFSKIDKKIVIKNLYSITGGAILYKGQSDEM